MVEIGQNRNFNGCEPHLYNVITQKSFGCRVFTQNLPYQIPGALKIESGKIFKHSKNYAIIYCNLAQISALLILAESFIQQINVFMIATLIPELNIA